MLTTEQRLHYLRLALAAPEISVSGLKGDQADAQVLRESIGSGLCQNREGWGILFPQSRRCIRAKDCGRGFWLSHCCCYCYYSIVPVGCHSLSLVVVVVVEVFPTKSVLFAMLFSVLVLKPYSSNDAICSVFSMFFIVFPSLPFEELCAVFQQFSAYMRRRNFKQTRNNASTAGIARFWIPTYNKLYQIVRYLHCYLPGLHLHAAKHVYIFRYFQHICGIVSHPCTKEKNLQHCARANSPEHLQ